MTITVTTDEELAVLLGTLGDTADEVADKLRAAGIKGKRMRSDCCPVANWLASTTGMTEPDVTDKVVGGYCGDGLSGFVRADAPRPVAEFVRRFDEGVHLDLVEAV